MVPSKEPELLLRCARTRIDETTAARIRELASGEIGWPGLRALAHQHRVMPLLYRSLYKTCPDLATKDALGHLRQDYQANAAWNMLLKLELLKILDLFKQHGIDVIPFKGPILAKVVYGDLALRMMSDLDLLVRKEDVPSANALLQSEGFQPEYPLEGFEQNANLQGPGACHFTGGDANIDLHWKIAPRTFTFDFGQDGYCSRLDLVSIERREVRVLSIGDRLLMLCGHGLRNAWSQIVMICDVAETIPHVSQQEWSQVFQRAKNLGSEDILHFGLGLARDLINVDLPENIQDQIRNGSNNDFLVHQVKTRLIRETDTLFSGPWWLRFQLQVRQNFMDKVKFLLRLAMTPNVDDLARKRLPYNLSFMYLFHRAVRLIGKYVLSPLNWVNSIL